MVCKHDCNMDYGFQSEDSIQECCADSDDDENDSAILGHEEKIEEDESVGSMWTNNSPNGEDCTAHNSTSNSIAEMEESLDTAWTDEKHSSYLNSIEASFVEQMYEKKYRALDICGHTPKQNDSSDTDCTESRPNFPSINKFKILQKGHWQKLNYNRAWHLGISTPRAVMASPWIRHFIPAPNFKGYEVPSQTVHECRGEHGIAAAGGPQINALESKQSCHTRTVHEAFPDANKQLCVQHHRIGYKFVDSKSICGKTEMRNLCKQESLVHPGSCFDKGERDIMRESNMERNPINRLIKKQKMKNESICCSYRDQVIEMEDSLDTAWTDDKHGSYLNSIQTSFVEQMYEKNCALDSGRIPKQNDSSDPDSDESRPNFASINKFKILQKGHWQKLDYNRAWHLGVSTPQAVIASPCIQHSIPAPYFKGHEVPSQAVHEYLSEHGIAAEGCPQMNALESKQSCHTRTVHDAFPDANKQLHVQHQRTGYQFADSKSICGITERRNICNKESLVRPGSCFDKGEQDIMRESNMERNPINRLMKKQKMKIESICCSDRDQ
ncbi:hypothetical protein KI387_024647, partial [Taxus chinensis]